MSVEVKITGATEFEARLGKVGRTVLERLRQTMVELTYKMRAEIRAEFHRAGLHTRSGHLIGSIEAGPVKEIAAGIEASVMVGQGLPYARSQEYGATISPKSATYLAIPLEAAKTARGVERFAPRQATSAGYDSTFVRHGVIFGVRGKEIVPLFALKKSVSLTAHPFVRPAFTTMEPIAHQAILEAVKGAVHA